VIAGYDAATSVARAARERNDRRHVDERRGMRIRFDSIRVTVHLVNSSVGRVGAIRAAARRCAAACPGSDLQRYVLRFRLIVVI
jgi:hypothetical protein